MTLILDKENPLATKVQTVGGMKARIICVDRKDQEYPIVALVEHDINDEHLDFFTSNGIAGWDKTHDLINVPEPKEDALFPCPFCGGTAKFYYGANHLACTSCNAHISHRSENFIKEWNTRAPQSQWIKLSDNMPEYDKPEYDKEVLILL